MVLNHLSFEISALWSWRNSRCGSIRSYANKRIRRRKKAHSADEPFNFLGNPSAKTKNRQSICSHLDEPPWAQRQNPACALECPLLKERARSKLTRISFLASE